MKTEEQIPDWDWTGKSAKPFLPKQRGVLGFTPSFEWRIFDGKEDDEFRLAKNDWFVRLFNYAHRKLGGATLALLVFAQFSAVEGSSPGADRIYKTVDFSQFHNHRLQIRSSRFPSGNVTLGGVPFAIPTEGNNEWDSGVGAVSGTFVIDIAVNQPGVAQVFTLINTGWGYPNDRRMKIEFFGSDGAYYFRDLVGGVDTRDWNAFFTDTVNGTTTVPVFTVDPGRDGNPDYIDMQRFDLPAAFLSQNLASIRITDQMSQFEHAGVLSGLTVSSIIPPPSPDLFIYKDSLDVPQHWNGHSTLSEIHYQNNWTYPYHSFEGNKSLYFSPDMTATGFDNFAFTFAQPLDLTGFQYLTLAYAYMVHDPVTDGHAYLQLFDSDGNYSDFVLLEGDAMHLQSIPLEDLPSGFHPFDKTRIAQISFNFFGARKTQSFFLDAVKLSTTPGWPNNPPSVSLTAPLNGGVFKAAPNGIADVPLRFTASDDDGVLTGFIWHFNSSDQSMCWECSLPSAPFKIGTHTVAISAIDNSGNRTTTDPVTFTVVASTPVSDRVYKTVDFSQFHNHRLQIRSSRFPSGNVTLGGVPFAIPTEGNNEWDSGVGAVSGTFVIDIAVNQPGVAQVFTLINTGWGYPNDRRMKIEFFGSDGAYYFRDLVGGVDTRDWNAFFTDTVNGTTTVPVFTVDPGRDGNPDYIDMQRFDLPAAFLSQNLASIRITDQMSQFEHAGVLSGLTVASIIPSSSPDLFIYKDGLDVPQHWTSRGTLREARYPNSWTNPHDSFEGNKHLYFFPDMTATGFDNFAFTFDQPLDLAGFKYLTLAFSHSVHYPVTDGRAYIQLFDSDGNYSNYVPLEGESMRLQSIPLESFHGLLPAFDKTRIAQISFNFFGTRISQSFFLDAVKLSTTPGWPNNPPSVSLTAPLNGSVFVAGPNGQADVPLSFTASDDDGVLTGFLWHFDSSDYSMCWECQLTYLPFQIGTHTVSITAIDNSGNRTTSAPVTFTVVASTPDLVLYSDTASLVSWPWRVYGSGFETSSAASEGTKSFQYNYLLGAQYGHDNFGFGVEGVEGVNVTSLPYLKFALWGSIAGGDSVEVHLFDSRGSYSKAVPIAPVTNSLGMYSVPVASLLDGTPVDPTRIAAFSVTVRGIGGHSGTVFVDDIRFSASP